MLSVDIRRRRRGKEAEGEAGFLRESRLAEYIYDMYAVMCVAEAPSLRGRIYANNRWK